MRSQTTSVQAKVVDLICDTGHRSAAVVNDLFGVQDAIKATGPMLPSRGLSSSPGHYSGEWIGSLRQSRSDHLDQTCSTAAGDITG
jgi:hypothetical protein